MVGTVFNTQSTMLSAGFSMANLVFASEPPGSQSVVCPDNRVVSLELFTEILPFVGTGLRGAKRDWREALPLQRPTGYLQQDFVDRAVFVDSERQAHTLLQRVEAVRSARAHFAWTRSAEQEVQLTVRCPDIQEQLGAHCVQTSVCLQRKPWLGRLWQRIRS